MGNYSKLIVAAIGFVAVLFGPDVLGLVADASAFEARLLEVFASIVSLLAVWRLKNEPFGISRKVRSTSLLCLLLIPLVLFMSGCSYFIQEAPEKIGKGVKYYCEKVVPFVSEDERQKFVDGVNAYAAPHSIEKADCVVLTGQE